MRPSRRELERRLARLLDEDEKFHLRHRMIDMQILYEGSCWRSLISIMPRRGCAA